MTELPPLPERKHREDRPDRERAPRKVRDDLATYRIAVGKRHKVGPGSIVGAIANEGGLHRSDFGHITIKADHLLVELLPGSPGRPGRSWRTPGSQVC